MQPSSLLSATPDIRLFGNVDESMLSAVLQQQANVAADKPVVLELSTSGGDADIGRRIAFELRLWQRSRGRELYFLGKTFVFSAGVTIMSAVPADHRFLSADCELLIHERKIKKVLHLDGALRGCRSLVQDALAEIDSGQRLERAGFADLVEGSRLTVDDVMDKVLERDWYLTAEQALQLGLIAGIV
jgi:ATP-dependent protease ClpP protease subunit